MVIDDLEELKAALEPLAHDLTEVMRQRDELTAELDRVKMGSAYSELIHANRELTAENSRLITQIGVMQINEEEFVGSIEGMKAEVDRLKDHHLATINNHDELVNTMLLSMTTITRERDKLAAVLRSMPRYPVVAKCRVYDEWLELADAALAALSGGGGE